MNGVFGQRTALTGQALPSCPPSSRSQRKAGPAPARAGLLLDKPERLWEAGGTEALPFSSPPPYLDGSYAGDRGFDPLRLAAIKPGFVADEKDGLAWLAEGELYNGRVAMTAVAGIVVQELLGKGPWWTVFQRLDLAPGIPENRSVIPHIWQCTVGQGTCPPEAYGGSQPYVPGGWQLAPGVDKYWGIITVLHLVFGWLELNRFRNFKAKGETGLGPWAPFDPLNLRSDRNRQAEVRNGRLAMLAVLGFAVQAKVTGLEPIEGLKAHLANPGNNILSNAPGTFYFVLAFSAFLGAIEVARKNAQESGQPLSRFEL